MKQKNVVRPNIQLENLKVYLRFLRDVHEKLNSPDERTVNKALDSIIFYPILPSGVVGPNFRMGLEDLRRFAKNVKKEKGGVAFLATEVGDTIYIVQNYVEAIAALREIEKLKDNWNSNGASSFSTKLIEKC